jgi:hypothetical protein
MADVTSLRELAAKYRKMAKQIGDERAREALLQLAAESDKEADELLSVSMNSASAGQL